MILIRDETQHCEHVVDAVRYFEHLCLNDPGLISMMVIEGNNPDMIYDAIFDFAHLAASPRRAALLFYSLMLMVLTECSKDEVSH
jgi:hypothetical protein